MATSGIEDSADAEPFRVRLNHAETIYDLAAMPPMILERLVIAVAVAEAQVAAIEQGIAPSQLELYDWTPERLVDGQLRSRADVRVRAQLRPIDPSLPAQLHPGTPRSGSLCRWCGRLLTPEPVRPAHVAPDGSRGPLSCRATSRVWTGVEDPSITASRSATPLG
jgi:hypothetical protein